MIMSEVGIGVGDRAWIVMVPQSWPSILILKRTVLRQGLGLAFRGRLVEASLAG